MPAPAAGDVVLGVLTVASTQPHAFDEVWEDVTDVLAVGILTSLRMEAMQYITRILEAMDLAEQPQDFIGLLLQGGQHRAAVLCWLGPCWRAGWAVCVWLTAEALPCLLRVRRSCWGLSQPACMRRHLLK
jgi:hypothetical protein